MLSEKAVSALHILSHQGSLLVLPSGMYSWSATDVEQLQAADFELVFSECGAADWMVIGTGETMVRPPRAVTKSFSDLHLPIDFMSTASAVRTYNVVLAEGRRVAAAFIAV